MLLNLVISLNFDPLRYLHVVSFIGKPPQCSARFSDKFLENFARFNFHSVLMSSSDIDCIYFALGGKQKHNPCDRCILISRNINLL